MSDSPKPTLTPFDKPERKRTYHFPNGSKFELTNVKSLCIRPSGTHRVETTDGRKWIIPPGWIAIELDIDEWSF